MSSVGTEGETLFLSVSQGKKRDFILGIVHGCIFGVGQARIKVSDFSSKQLYHSTLQLPYHFYLKALFASLCITLPLHCVSSL